MPLTFRKKDIKDSLLEKTLGEEKEADTLLTEAAYNTINFDANQEDQDQE